MINFDVKPSEKALIAKIAEHAAELGAKFRAPKVRRKVLDYEMDITATHANGNPLRLAELLDADDLNFAHDVFGIERHLNRESGELGDCFVPRYSQRQG